MVNELGVRSLIHKNIIEKFLLGPQNGDEEVIKNDSPLNFYVTGVLYPQEPATCSDEMFSDDDTYAVTPMQHTNDYNASKGEDGNESGDEILLSSDFKPSAIGLSTIVGASAKINIKLQLGTYNKTADPDRQDKIALLKSKHPKLTDEELPPKYSLFKRNPIVRDYQLDLIGGDDLNLYDSENKKLVSGVNKIYIDTDKKNSEPWVRLYINKRPLPSDASKCIITVTLTNELIREKKTQKAPQFCLFQPKIRLETSPADFHAGEDRTDLESRPEEIKSLHLQYLKYASFATGHGCSVSWENSEKSELPTSEWLKPKRFVQTEIIPSYEVAMSDVDFKDSSRFEGIKQVFDLKRLIPEHYGGISSKILLQELTVFIDRYRLWIEQQRSGISQYLNDLGFDAIIQSSIFLKSRQKKIWIPARNYSFEWIAVLRY